jgi:uncharacterized protein
MIDAVRPTSTSERIDALDAMRGMAILGVLLAYTMWSLGNTPEETWTGTDRAIAWGVGVFVDNKFLSMFAFLFGMGVTQQWRRWEDAGLNPVPYHLRRMGFLLGIGFLHATLLRNGDILMPYALLGLALLAFRKASNRTIAIAIPIFFLAPYVIDGALELLHLSWPPRPGAISGGYLIENVTWLRYWYETNPFLGFSKILCLMLLGVLAGRARTVEVFSRDRSLAIGALAVALPLAVLTWLLHHGIAGLGGASWLKSKAVQASFEISSYALAATYISGLLVLLQSARVTRALWPLRAVGRMAFTNYLSQATIIVPLCLLLGWFDKVSPRGGLALAAALGALQLFFATWWLRSHAAGPFERIWRRFTYRA